MPPTDRQRHDAYEALSALLGEHTDTVIEMLRPDETHLATKQDLAELRADFHQALAAQTRTLLLGLLTAIILMSLTAAVGPLAG